MMANMHQFINNIVLALSLATIILTLLTYLIYKIKQLPKGLVGQPEQKQETTFFKRYNPYVVTQTVADTASEDVGLLAKIKTLPVFFVLMGLLIFGSLVSAKYFSAREITSTRKARAEKYQTLVAEGLLKKQDFNPRASNPKLKERVGVLKKQTALTIETLSGKRVFLFESPSSQRFHKDGHQSALKSWEKFLNRQKIAFTKSTHLAVGKGMDVVILPQVKSLNQKERDVLEALITENVSILATGQTGALDGTGELVSPSWAEVKMDLSFVKNEDPENTYPTLSSSRQVPWFSLPPGVLIDWMPLDNDFKASATTKASALFEASYQGRVRENSVRSHHKSTSANRFTWLAVDPPTEALEEDSERSYVDAALVSSLAWTARAAQANVSTWQHAYKNAVVIGIDTEAQPEGAEDLQELLSDYDVPATLFATNEALKQLPELVTKANAKLDIAALAIDHRSVKGQTLAQQFEAIQEVRLALEEESGRPVLGYRPFGEKFDESTLNAASQNKMGYFVGDQRLHRFAPAWIEKTGLLYYPRVALDDVNLAADATLAEPSQIADTLVRDMERIHDLGGLYFLSLHSQVFGQKPYLDAVELFLKRLEKSQTWRTEFKSVTKWWSEKEKIEVRIKDSIEVLNSNKSDVAGVSIVIDLGSEKRAPVADKKSYQIKPLASGSYEIVFQNLQGNSRTHVAIQDLEFKGSPASESLKDSRGLASPAKESASQPTQK